MQIMSSPFLLRIMHSVKPISRDAFDLGASI